MSAEPSAGDLDVIPADQAAYPPRQVWAAAHILAGYDPVTPVADLDAAEDEVRCHFYMVAEEALIAAREAAEREASTR